MVRVAIVTIFIALAAGVFVSASGHTSASNPGPTVTPLLSCPNVDGSLEGGTGGVRVSDILTVVQAYFKDYPATNYVFMYDLVAPYNPQTGTGGKQRVDDILAVVNAYFDSCPLVDTQVAKATRWVLTQHPELLTENVSALAAAGYVGIAAIDVPGQGVHYAKSGLVNGIFNPEAPEGLVYKYGRLAAQLYLMSGTSVGWLVEDPGPNAGPCGDGIDNGSDGFTDGADADCVLGPAEGTPPDDVDIDQLAYCGPGLACSWATDEGWHMHYRICIVHIGTPYAHFVALGSGQGQAACDAVQAAPPNANAGTASFFERLGWMGHLWNWLPNANGVPDVNGSMNGRFADCFPDADGWKAYNCPQ